MRWRRHTLLGVTAGAVVLVVLAAHEVMLPFVLAVVLAYVLTPLVAIVERRRAPRAAAVPLGFSVVLRGVGGLARGVGPPLRVELTAPPGGLPRPPPPA